VKQSIVFRTLGCKQNQFDTEMLRHRILRRGLSEVEDIQRADWLIINTCAVTRRAMAKARGELHRLRRLNPDAKIAVVGCGARYQPEQFGDADYIGELPKEITDKAKSSGGEAGDGVLSSPHGFLPRGRSRALLRIQSGCDQFCAFCIVPFLRGQSKSAPSGELIRSIRRLVESGVFEIVLTGTNIALWGRDLKPPQTLFDLLRELLPHLGPSRLRLSSLEPHLISAEMIAWCAAQEQICDHFHLALQSGSKRVLEAMNRRIPEDGFFDALSDLKQRHPRLSFGADVIAGLPGETEEDFACTLDLLQKIPFNYLHVFPYSEREGTAAARRDDRVPERIRLARAAALRAKDIRLRHMFMLQNEDRSHDIVIIHQGKKRPEGLTSNYLRVSFGSDFSPKRARFYSTLSSRELAGNYCARNPN
jgi:threonylcarbamoyladenosine tRNA methylthiotransferase MtaB